jgi:hypothetical protein
MILSSKTLYLALWAVVVAAECSLTLVLFWRRAWRENAAFTSFMVFCVLRSSLLLYAFFALKSSSACFFLRLGAYPVQFVLLIAVVLEVVQIIFRPYEALPRGTLGNFVLATLTVAVFSVMFTVRFPGTHPSEWIMLFRAIDQGFSWVLWGIFAIFTLFSSCLGIPWNHRAYGIVVGFFFYLSVDVAVVTMTAQLGIPSSSNYIWPLDMLAFVGACSVWTYSFAHAEVPRRVPTMEEVRRLSAVLSQYVVLIESLEVKRQPARQSQGAGQWKLNIGGERDAQ